MVQGIAGRNLVSRLLHIFQLLFSNNVSVRLFRNLFTQGQDSWLIKSNQGDTNTAAKERV